LYKNCWCWKNFDCIFGFSVKSYVRNTINLSCAKILSTSVIAGRCWHVRTDLHLEVSECLMCSGNRHTASACTVRLKCDGSRAENRFRLSPKWTSPFKSAGASVQLTAGSRGVRLSGSNAGYTTFRGSVKSTGYPLHSPVSTFTSPSRASPCVIRFQSHSTYFCL